MRTLGVRFELTVFMIFRKGFLITLNVFERSLFFYFFRIIKPLEKHFYLGYTYNKATGKVEDVLGNEVSSELDIKWDTNVANWLNCVYMAKGFFNGVRCSQGLTCKQLFILF